MNQTLETIFERRSVRKYTEQEVPQEIVEKIIAAGCMAPSSLNQQPWNFHVSMDRDHIKAFSKAILKTGAKEFMMKTGMDQPWKAISGLTLNNTVNFLEEDDPIFHNAPVLIIVTGPKFDDFVMMDIAMCVQNMLLAAKSLGLDSCPSAFAKLIQFTDLVNTLDIPKEEEIYLGLVVGYGAESPAMLPRKANNIHYI